MADAVEESLMNIENGLETTKNREKIQGNWRTWIYKHKSRYQCRHVIGILCVASFLMGLSFAVLSLHSTNAYSLFENAECDNTTEAKAENLKNDVVHKQIVAGIFAIAGIILSIVNLTIGSKMSYKQFTIELICPTLEVFCTIFTIIELNEGEDMKILGALGSVGTFLASTITTIGNLKAEVDIGEDRPPYPWFQTIKDIFDLLLTQGCFVSLLLLVLKRFCYLRDQLESIISSLLLILIVLSFSIFSTGFTTILFPKNIVWNGDEFHTYNFPMVINGLIISICFFTLEALYAVKTSNVDQTNDSFIGCSGKNLICPESTITQNMKKYVLEASDDDSGRKKVEENYGGIRKKSLNDSYFQDVKGTVLDIVNSSVMILKWKADGKFRQQCIKEVRYLYATNHLHIVSLVGKLLDSSNNTIGVLIENVEETLDYFMEEADEDEWNSRPHQKWAKQLSDAIHYCHSKLGIILNSVDPSRILLNQEKKLKLFDFGYSCLPGEIIEDIPGRKNYRAPEMLLTETKQGWTHKADIYSFSLVLYSIYYRRIPFDNFLKYNTEKEFYEYLRVRNRPPLYDNDLVSEDIRKTIFSCWSFCSTRRPEASYLCSKFGKMKVE